MKLHENKTEMEQALLVSVDTGAYDAETSLEELEELAKTAGACVLGTMIQKRDAPSAAAYVGSGRLEEIAAFCRSHGVDLIIVDGELTPTQLRNLEDGTDTRVVDRTMLILDIFAARAISRAGKLQVELAQLKYTLPRLTGKGTQLSRLGGGIGTRGPGETKLESDRRHIRRRLEHVQAALDSLEAQRTMIRRRRKKSGADIVALVGYTNAGKSTLMNRLTQAGVLAEDKLFATLDPTARQLELPDGRQVVLVDTVGFVRRLPHHLVEAFRSTLEEAVEADLILNVCDASSPDCAEHLQVTMQLLEELGCTGNILNVLNKCDLAPNLLDLPIVGKSVPISALHGTGTELLLNEITQNLPRRHRHVALHLPFDQIDLVAKIREDGGIQKEEFQPDGVYIEALVDVRHLHLFQDYLN
ncbi:MAG: GTPase HflX [Clostridiales bacterium]|nr:GTPase HflX [Clostridiales bacterium]